MEQELNTEDTGQEQVGFTEIEQRAIDMGWRPKDEFSGEDDDFVDAKEFVARKPLYDKISQQSKQIKNVTQAVEALKNHYGKVQETEYQRALSDLKEQRKQALIEGDADKFTSIDDKIKTTEREVSEIQRVQETPIVKEEQAVHPEFAAFQNRNPWYGSVKYMKDFADELGGRLASTMSPGEVLKEVERAIRKEFPHKFTNPNKDSAPDVGTAKSQGRSTKNDSFELNEQEARIMNTLVRSGTITKDQYISDLKKIKGIK